MTDKSGLSFSHNGLKHNDQNNSYFFTCKNEYCQTIMVLGLSPSLSRESFVSSLFFFFFFFFFVLLCVISLQTN